MAEKLEEEYEREKHKQLGAGKIVGIVIGTVVSAIIVAYLIYLFIKWMRGSTGHEIEFQDIDDDISELNEGDECDVENDQCVYNLYCKNNICVMEEGGDDDFE